MKNHILMAAVLVLMGCGSMPSANGGRALNSKASIVTQFYLGKIQRSSLDEKQPFGPPFRSIVKRTVDPENGVIQECVFQENKFFLTTMQRTKDLYKYEVLDTGGFSKGYLIFSDESLSSWSYDIDVVKPVVGKITGDLKDARGARISSDGRMEIRKVWNQQMMIHEMYDSISEDQYETQIKLINIDETPQVCR